MLNFLAGKGRILSMQFFPVSPTRLPRVRENKRITTESHPE